MYIYRYTHMCIYIQMNRLLYRDTLDMKMRPLFACIMCQNIKTGKFRQVLHSYAWKYLLNSLQIWFPFSRISKESWVNLSFTNNLVLRTTCEKKKKKSVARGGQGKVKINQRKFKVKGNYFPIVMFLLFNHRIGNQIFLSTLKVSQLPNTDLIWRN